MNSRNRLSVCTTAIGLLVVFASKTSAQDSTAQKTHRYCWRGRPAPTCDGFLLTELTYFRAIVNPSATLTYPSYGDPPATYRYDVHPSEWKFSAEVVGMINRGKHSAVGGTLLIDGGPEGASIGLKGRYRRWLTPEGIALDFGAGFQTTKDKVFRNASTSGQPILLYQGPRNSVGFTGDVALNASEYVAIVSRVDINKFDSRLQPTVSLGVRAESRPAVFALGGIGITYGVLILLFLSFWDE